MENKDKTTILQVCMEVCSVLDKVIGTDWENKHEYKAFASYMDDVMVFLGRDERHGIMLEHCVSCGGKLPKHNIPCHG